MRVRLDRIDCPGDCTNLGLLVCQPLFLIEMDPDTLPDTMAINSQY